MSDKEIADLLETIEDNVPIEEYRSEGTDDELCHYELDEDSWQYKTLEFVRDLYKENQQLKEQLEKIKQPQIFIDTDIEDRYGYELENDYLKEKLQYNDLIVNGVLDYIDKELLEISKHQYAIGKRRLTTIKNQLTKYKVGSNK